MAANSTVEVFPDGHLVVRGEDEADCAERLEKVRQMVLWSETCVSCNACVPRCPFDALELPTHQPPTNQTRRGSDQKKILHATAWRAATEARHEEHLGYLGGRRDCLRRRGLGGPDVGLESNVHVQLARASNEHHRRPNQLALDQLLNAVQADEPGLFVDAEPRPCGDILSRHGEPDRPEGALPTHKPGNLLDGALPILLGL